MEPRGEGLASGGAGRLLTRTVEIRDITNNLAMPQFEERSDLEPSSGDLAITTPRRDKFCCRLVALDDQRFYFIVDGGELGEQF